MTDRRADCIVFLDFDGVTHPDPCEMGRLFTKLPLIEAVLRRFDACKIVISSSWRVVHPLDEMREYFAVDMQSHVIGVTPQQRAWDLMPSYSRQWECEAWLRSDRRLDSPVDRDRRPGRLVSAGLHKLAGDQFSDGLHPGRRHPSGTHAEGTDAMSSTCCRVLLS